MASQGPKETKEIIRSGLTCDTDAFEDLPVDFFLGEIFFWPIRPPTWPQKG